MQNSPKFLQYTAAYGTVYSLNINAVCQWQYCPAEPETAEDEGQISRLIVTTSIIDFYYGGPADYFYRHLKSYAVECANDERDSQ
jgi:hypothetical protein